MDETYPDCCLLCGIVQPADVCSEARFWPCRLIPCGKVLVIKSIAGMKGSHIPSIISTSPPSGQFWFVRVQNAGHYMSQHRRKVNVMREGKLLHTNLSTSPGHVLDVEHNHGIRICIIGHNADAVASSRTRGDNVLIVPANDKLPRCGCVGKRSALLQCIVDDNIEVRWMNSAYCM